MTESNKINWKSSQVLKVFGTTIREGTFTGSKPTNSGIITNDAPTTFTPEYIQMLYNNAKSPVEFVVMHSAGNNETIGFTTKIGVNDEKDDLKYEGFVFDDAAYKKITTEGFGYVSPEIVESRDDNGNLVDARLVRIAFVQHPAVPNYGAAIVGTDVGMEPIVFSKGTANDTVDNTMTETTDTITPEASGTQTVTTDSNVSTVTPPAPQVVTPTVTKPVGNNTPVTEEGVDLNTVMKELNDTKSTVETLRKHNEKLLNEQYNGMVGELKTLGVDNPSELVKGLDMEQKLEVLGKLKGTLAKNKPMAAATQSTTTVDTGSKDKAIDDALASLGYRKADYDKLIQNANKR